MDPSFPSFSLDSDDDEGSKEAATNDTQNRSKGRGGERPRIKSVSLVRTCSRRAATERVDSGISDHWPRVRAVAVPYVSIVGPFVRSSKPTAGP